MVDRVSVRFKDARVEKGPLNIIVHSAMREPLACRRLGVRAKNASVSGFACGPSKGYRPGLSKPVFGGNP